MTRRVSLFTAIVLLLLTAFRVSPAVALEEPERLWLVSERAFADGLYPLARRTLERFVERYPRDTRAPLGVLMLGKARFRLGELEPALEALRRALAFTPPPGQGLEARFWEAEVLFRLKRYSEARAAYEEVQRNDAAGPFGPDALYGYGWTELELKRPEPAVTAFRDFLQAWPEHALEPSATYHLGRALVELKRYDEAVPVLADFRKKFPNHKLAADAQYLLGWTRVTAGETQAGVADLRAFLAAYPNHDLAADARKLARQAAARTGDKTALSEQYQVLMAEKPPTPEGLAEAFAIAGRLGRPREADAAWRKLRTEFPSHAVTHRTAFDLADAAFKRQDWKEAVALADVAARSDDDTIRSEALLLAGESELKLKRFASAVKAFEGVGAVAKTDPTVRYRALAGLGLAREEQKEYRAALSAYESVASKSPDPALRDWARARATAVKSRLVAPPAGAKPKPKPS